MKKTLSTQLLTAATALAALCHGVSAAAGIYPSDAGSLSYSSGSLDKVIPDNSNSGLAYSFNLSSSETSISDISVTLHISGGWNGDLYSYISHGSQTAVLLNRIGASADNAAGSGSSGFNITLNLASANDIHTAIPTVGSTISGTYSADGRVSYQDTDRPQTLDVFSGADPNGAWTIFFADQSPTYTSTLNDFSVEVSAVPEPTSAALSLFGLLAGVCVFVRKHLTRG